MKTKPTKEQVREYNRTYRERHPGRRAETCRAYLARQRAKLAAEKSRIVMVALTIGQSVAIVPLNEGRYALVDAADFDTLRGPNWYVFKSHRGKEYVASHRPFKGRRRCVLMHQYLFEGQVSRIDHQNGNGLDNRRSNLRPCTQSQNCANQHKVRGAVPFKGVTRLDGKFFAQARKHGKNYSLGLYTDPTDAARAYDRKAKELFGEFARTNESLGLIPAHTEV